MLKRQLISIVSAGLLAVHVSMGCCAHHQHEYDGSAIITIAADSGDQHSLATEHGTCDHSAPRHEHRPGDHHCGEGRCAFLRFSKTSVPQQSMSFTNVVPTGSTALLVHVGQQATTQSAPTDGFASRSVRSHLAKQVFLI
jgi:hypothetical protein